MPLLAPLFLLGLAAVGIPLLVHLVRRETRNPIAFPSLMFIVQAPAPVASRRRLRNPWLFLLRALAVILLVLAFTRPVLFPPRTAAGVDLRRREVVLLIDRSFSMRIGQRWPRARAAADSVIDALAARDRLTLVPFDRLATVATASSSDAPALRAVLAVLTPTDESTRLAPAMAIAQQRLAASDAPRKALVIISDMQRSAWDLTDDARLDAGVEVATINVGDGAAVLDRAVRAVEVRLDRRSGKPQLLITARLANAGPAARDVVTRLEVAGRLVEERRVDLPRDGGAAVTFAALSAPAASVAARVVLAPDALPGDDAFSVVLDAPGTLPVLLIENGANPYLAPALSIGDLPRFDVLRRSPARATVADLTGRRLVILADGALPRAIGAGGLLRFVQQGGGLMIALGAEFHAADWSGTAAPLMAGRVQPIVNREGSSGAVLGTLDQQHPALALLTGASAGDLTAARFDRYRPIDATNGVLARFADGTAALTERRVGRGRVLTFGSSLDGSWNDLPRQPAFLPLMQQLSRYTAAWRDTPRAFEIGASLRVADLVQGRTANVARWVATAPSGARRELGNGSDSAVTVALNEAGVHELRPGGMPGARPVLAAANIARAELDFATFDAVRLADALAPRAGASVTRTSAIAQETPVEREARQSIWWYLLLAAVLLLAAESVIARRSMRQSAIAA